MKNLEAKESVMSQDDEFVEKFDSSKPNMNNLKRRQSSVRREIIVEGEFCKLQMLKY